jgi:hypothetical protein
MDDLPETTQDLLTSPRVPVVDNVGNAYTVPLPSDEVLQGQFGGNAFAFTFSASITTPPADGGLRLNDATYADAFEIYVDYQDANGSNVSGWLGSLDNSAGSPKGRLRLYSQANPLNWADYTLDSVADSTGYYTLSVTWNADSGTALGTTAGDLVLDFTPTSDGSIGGFDSTQNLKTVTDTYTLELADAGYLISGNKGTAFNITVPPQADVAWVAGTHIDIFQLGAGQITIVAGSGVTILAAPGLKLNGQYAAATLVRTATSNTWYLMGNLTS